VKPCIGLNKPIPLEGEWLEKEGSTLYLTDEEVVVVVALVQPGQELRHELWASF
jgi:hypothetical protein